MSGEELKQISARRSIANEYIAVAFLVESEKIYTLAREVVEEVLTEYFKLFYGYTVWLKQENYELFSAIYSSSTIEEDAEKLGIEITY